MTNRREISRTCTIYQYSSNWTPTSIPAEWFQFSICVKPSRKKSWVQYSLLAIYDLDPFLAQIPQKAHYLGWLGDLRKVLATIISNTLQVPPEDVWALHTTIRQATHRTHVRQLADGNTKG